jgi:hypothetical protein
MGVASAQAVNPIDARIRARAKTARAGPVRIFVGEAVEQPVLIELA